MKTPLLHSSGTRRLLSVALLIIASFMAAMIFIAGGSSLQATATTESATQSPPAGPDQQAPDVVAFKDSVGGSITPVIVELKDEPGVIRKLAAEQRGQNVSLDEIGAYAVELYGKQETFLQTVSQRGVRVMMREADVPQIDGSVRHVEYRFTYLLNGFAGYVASADLETLRAQPEVAHVSVVEPEVYHLDKAIDYSLGTSAVGTAGPDRRAAVYGANQEFGPDGVLGHQENPRTTKIDGFEGQNMTIAVIDSGVDWRHPMFGGIGHGTPLPRVSGEPESPDDNRKVIYYYALSSPGDPTDDFGHGTHVASTAAGYAVDGNTTPRTGFGLGRDGTGVGPTINGEQLFGTAPQARIMAYKVCGPANACLGDIPLAIEDAASPFTLVSSGNTGPTPVAKPVADVINLSLGSTAGDPAASNSRAANNAALAGTIVVASAGNSGPGLGTVGNPGVATLAIGVAASHDPGSASVTDVLAPGQIPGEVRQPTAGPAPEKGAPSESNTTQPGERTGMRIFPVAGGGPIPDGSLSAHYVFVDRRGNPPPEVPASATNRIAVVKGSGTFAQIANPVAALNPAAIFIVTSVESATAVQVINGIPTFTIGPADGNYLIDLINPGADAGDGNDDIDVPNGTISEFPIRISERPTFETFSPGLAGFSSRGPARHANANYRMLKPDIAAPGYGIVAAATIEGVPDETVGMASTTGYTSANGTSMASPLTAGAITLIRQRIREQLNLDSTNPADRAKRFDTVTVARAMLQNSATNLRDAYGVPQGDGAASVAAVNEMGAGLLNIADALTARAIMVSPTLLLTSPSEFTPQPAGSGPRTVLVPTASFGAVPVVRLNDTIVRTREVIIRDVTGDGGGTYSLSWQNNRLADHPGFGISFTASASDTNPISSINVPAGGQASFFVRVTADGTQIDLDPTEFQWYVTAIQTSTAKTMRMPFYFRAVTAVFPNSVPPALQPIANTESNTTPCPTDTNGSYTANWTYTTPAHVGFRLQEATQSQTIFFDNADEPLAPGLIGTTVTSENSKWRDAGIAGTPQTPPMWETQVNPDTQSPAYFIAAANNQNHSLTTKAGSDPDDGIVLPNTAITLSFRTRVNLDNNVDFGYVEVTTDNLNWNTILSLTGTSSGVRTLDLSGYAGQTIRLRFRLATAQTGFSSAAGFSWYVEDIRIESDNYHTVADVPSATRSVTLSGKPAGTYTYRVAALYASPVDPGATITGPFSTEQCVTVTAGPPPVSAVSRKTHNGVGVFDVNLPLAGTPASEPRTGGANGQHQMIVTFPANVSVASAHVSSGSGNVDSVSASGSEVTVNLSSVANAQRIAVTLGGVSDGSTTGSVTIPMAVLLGDSSADGTVNSGDAQQVRNRSGQTTNATNFRTDVNIDGTVNSGDAFIVRGQSGTTSNP